MSQQRMKYSYSRMSLYGNCPKAFWYRYIQKVAIDTDNPVFEKGKYLHALLETYPAQPDFNFKFEETKKNKLEYMKLVSDLCRNDSKIKFLLSISKYREKQFYLDKNLNNCEAKDQLINGVIDYVGETNDTIVIVDWKSGKTQKYASVDQLKLYAIWAFNEFPKIKNMVLFFYFIEQNTYIRLDVDRRELPILKKLFLDKINKIENDTEFKKCVKQECTFCDYYKECKPFNVQMKGK